VTTPASELHNPITSSGDNCPNCGASLAPDQRYCLNCGQRRGDPRLPFMDAVVFMESSKRQPQQPSQAPAAAPPPDRRPFMSANASLVAGVATLILAIGVGVLIGRSGDSGSSNAGNAAPQIIRVGGSGETEAESSAGGKASKGSTSGKSNGNEPKSKTAKKAKKKLETTSSGATKATEEAYPTAPGVKIAPPEQKIGGECEPGVAGCGKNGKFEGTFFE
jgi:hypothetical protein